MDHHGRFAVRVATHLPVDLVAIPDVETALGEGFEGWIHSGRRLMHRFGCLAARNPAGVWRQRV